MFGIEQSSVKKISELVIRKSDRNGIKIKFPIILIMEIGNPQCTSIGSDTIVQVVCTARKPFMYFRNRLMIVFFIKVIS